MVTIVLPYGGIVNEVALGGSQPNSLRRFSWVCSDAVEPEYSSRSRVQASELYQKVMPTHEIEYLFIFIESCVFFRVEHLVGVLELTESNILEQLI